jgi:uncharacterized membrane protein YphA (DoxX/SURF4 family)
MKGVKEIITGTGFLISGSLGVSIGNLEKTLFFSAPRADSFVPSVTYFLFSFFIIVGCIYIILGFKKKND